MNRKDYWEVWGYLQTLKDTLEENAGEAVKPGDKNLGAGAAGNYMQTCAKITAVQGKIDEEAEELE